MKDLIEGIAKALVNNPDEVTVRIVEDEGKTILALKVAQGDLGQVIGKKGRTVQSIRTLLRASGRKLKKQFTLELVE